MKTMNTKQAYKAPLADILEVNARRVLCQSGSGEGDTEIFHVPGYYRDDNDFEDGK